MPKSVLLPKREIPNRLPFKSVMARMSVWVIIDSARVLKATAMIFISAPRSRAPSGAAPPTWPILISPPTRAWTILVPVLM